MKHAVIVAHPNPKSFNLTMAETYAVAVRAAGDEPLLRDLYRVPFDPLLQTGEIPTPAGFAAGQDVEAERALLKDVDVYCLVYPLWFNTPPAMMKGYLERVFGMGFGYAPGGWGNDPLLDG
jgi:NAD(P)H dehydrogenase (quinone)